MPPCRLLLSNLFALAILTTFISEPSVGQSLTLRCPMAGFLQGPAIWPGISTTPNPAAGWTLIFEGLPFSVQIDDNDRLQGGTMVACTVEYDLNKEHLVDIMTYVNSKKCRILANGGMLIGLQSCYHGEPRTAEVLRDRCVVTCD
jgi:hypothetical protein